MSLQSLPPAFDFAAQLVEQLITLATGIIALTITFATGLGKNSPRSAVHALLGAWCAFLLSIIFGIWALMALTGQVDAATVSGSVITIYTSNIRIPTGLQILSFLAGVGLAIWYGALALHGSVQNHEEP